MIHCSLNGSVGFHKLTSICPIKKVKYKIEGFLLALRLSGICQKTDTKSELVKHLTRPMLKRLLSKLGDGRPRLSRHSIAVKSQFTCCFTPKEQHYRRQKNSQWSTRKPRDVVLPLWHWLLNRRPLAPSFAVICFNQLYSMEKPCAFYQFFPGQIVYIYFF